MEGLKKSMETAEKVKLYTMWVSPFVRRVELALRVKGITYERVEEDLTNKSQDLLLYNHVHRAVPVLVHNDKPVSESLVIIEYIEETWKNSPSILPDDRYERAKIRFWASFIDLKLMQQLRMVLIMGREEDVKEMSENLDKLEANMNDIFPSGTPQSEGGNMGLLDILICTYSGVIGAVEEIREVKFMDPNKYPLTMKWIKAFAGLEIVKETTPSHEKLVRYFKLFAKE